MLPLWCQELRERPIFLFVDPAGTPESKNLLGNKNNFDPLIPQYFDRFDGLRSVLGAEDEMIGLGAEQEVSHGCCGVVGGDEEAGVAEPVEGILRKAEIQGRLAINPNDAVGGRLTLQLRTGQCVYPAKY
jgi:hypothetical protein